MPSGITDQIDTVSLVITCFNHGRFLAEAIDSALSQRRPFDEILVVDDGSTDETAAVAHRYQDITYVRQENQGLSSARNTGLRAVSGTFVMFLDADDRLVHDAVSAGLACFQRNPYAAFVFGRYQDLNASGLAAPTSARREAHDAYGDLLRFNFIRMHATVMYRRATILALGGYDSRLRASEDYDLYLRVAQAYPIAAHDAVVAHYRKHASNMSLDSRLMLRSTMLVLRRHKPGPSTDPSRRQQYREGIRNWQQHFGTQLGAHLLKGVRPGVSRRKLMSDALFTLFVTPRALLKHRSIVYRTLGSSVLARLPAAVRPFLARRMGFHYRPPVGRVNVGDLRSHEPLCRRFGYGRGNPVDRYYIERFLEQHAERIRGRVLEVGDDTYTRRYGADRVMQVDVLNVDANVPGTTIAGDLGADTAFPADAFDCIVLTQTLHLVWDVKMALATLHRMLRPGGTLLLTVPGTISQVERGRCKETWFWGFGPTTMQKLLAEAFASPEVSVDVHGNALASIAFLEGMAAQDLKPSDLDVRDEQYPLLITVCATRAGTARCRL